MTTPKPTAKANLIFPTIANALLDNKTVVRIEKRDTFDKKAQKWTTKGVPLSVPTLAGNVSQHNVDRILARLGVSA